MNGVHDGRSGPAGAAAAPAGPAGLEDALALAALPEDILLPRAEALCRAAFGDTVRICAIISARSGGCGMDCAFCSQGSRSSADIPRFPMLDEETLRGRILRLADSPAWRIGVVTSGGALHGAELDVLERVLTSLPEEIRARVCTSLGRLPAASMARLAACGVRRYHHNLETSSSFYPRICSTQTWEQRRDTVLRAREAGLENCTGGLFGLGESWEDRCRFALELRDLGVTNVPMNFLHAHPGTPLAGAAPLGTDEILRIIAVFRCILPTATLRICGGRPLIPRERQAGIFRAGANALMTGDYLTTAGSGADDDLRLIAAAGRVPAHPGGRA